MGKYFAGLHPAIASLTISHLPGHSSGIPDHYAFTDTNKVKHATDKEVLEAKKISGSSYTNFLKQQVFDPLGMAASTVFQMREKIRNRVGIPYPDRHNPPTELWLWLVYS